MSRYEFWLCAIYLGFIVVMFLVLPIALGSVK